jgi:hypothetical protein
MKAKIEGGNLVITLPLDKEGRPSSTGKTNIHATTNGGVKVPDVIVNGKPLTISVNAYAAR